MSCFLKEELNMYSYCKQHAFTLFETLITLSIIAIIIMIAIPNFQHYIALQEVSQLLPLVRQHVNFAKNTAQIYHSNIVVCSSSTFDRCEINQWHKGIIVFSDLNNNKSIDKNETIHKYTQTNLKFGSLKWNGGVTSPTMITFQSDTGLPHGSPGGFYYCSFTNKDLHRYLPISRMGHTRIETTTAC